jgi:hypothetical protein
MTPEFRAGLKEKLAPILRAQGFLGSGITFRRQVGEVLQVLNVQGSRHGDSCCVNLGMHLAFLPTVLGDPADPKRITESLCEFRRRLSPVGESDHWWRYGADAGEASRSVENLVDLVRTVALPHFEYFRDFPGAFEGITPTTIASGDFRTLPGNVTAARGALVMARIATHLGNRDRAREFAEVGLASLGPSATMGVGVARDLATLARHPGGPA